MSSSSYLPPPLAPRTPQIDPTTISEDLTISTNPPDALTDDTTRVTSTTSYRETITSTTPTESLQLPSGAATLSSGTLHNTTTNASPTRPTNANATNTDHPGLSAGAKGGIGVGVVLAAAVIIGAIVWFSRRYTLIRKPTQKAEPSDLEKREDSVPPQAVLHEKAELDPDREVLEAENTARPHEADSKHVRSELEGDGPARAQASDATKSDIKPS